MSKLRSSDMAVTPQVSSLMTRPSLNNLPHMALSRSLALPLTTVTTLSSESEAAMRARTNKSAAVDKTISSKGNASSSEGSGRFLFALCLDLKMGNKGKLPRAAHQANHVRRRSLSHLDDVM